MNPQTAQSKSFFAWLRMATQVFVTLHFPMLTIEIDSHSGFCFGVVNAIRKAEDELEQNKMLFCLGDIVHNTVEVERLKAKGLITINHNEFANLHDCKVLIRAHGEPPETYQIAAQNNIEIIDATCPVVLKLQQRIKTGYENIKPLDGQVVIFGKKGHAEVNGLVGQTSSNALIIESLEDISKIDFSKPITVFSQTTKSIDKYFELIEEIKKRLVSVQGDDSQLITHDTICRQVSNRERKLQQFAKKHDAIVFVSDTKSSNGKVLYEMCKSKNQYTYFVSDVVDIQANWFINIKSVGICGATSTPRWLMEKIGNEIKQIADS